jgi:CRISPR system Cascade subunit CasD
MDILLLRFDAPLMSFGGVMVDQHGPTDRFPGLSLLAGLLGNALGLRHGAAALETLQGRIEYAARWDLSPEPEPLLDYHTVDLGQDKMLGYADPKKKAEHGGWTTRGAPEHRAGGDSARYGTHIRYRHYWANGVMTLAVGLTDTETPTVADLAAAMDTPARPLFLGRKTCLPAAPVLLGCSEAPDVLTALRRVPRARRPAQPAGPGKMEACWPAHLGGSTASRELTNYDRRDWYNQIHAGQRRSREGLIEEETP